MEDAVSQHAKQFEAFLEATEEARLLQERDRDFVDLRQWTADEEAVLRERGQAPVVFDYVREQVDYLVGMERDLRADPRAYPRTQQHEEAADACTDALRYVADRAEFPQTASECFEDFVAVGVMAAIVEPELVGDQYEIRIRGIPWDRFYYDPHSRRRDFKDATYLGIVVWLDLDEVKKLYGGKARDLEGRFTSVGDGLDDAPRGWFDTKRKRVRVCQHYYLKDGKWHVCHFTGDTMLLDSKPVPLVDENGEPECPIEAQAAYVDRENNRYGYVRRLIDPQTEVNHRRSKALFLLSARQVLAEEGSVADQYDAKRELKKPDGWVNLNPGALTNGSIQINQTGDMAQGQLGMYQDAVAKLQASGANAAMQGDVEGMSGRAIQRLQTGGKVQIGSLFDAYRAWKRRVYRQAWNRVKQFWDAPMWIRVTDDEQNLQWVGLNQPVTVGQQLLEAAKAGDQQAAMMLREALATQDPRLNQPVDTRNKLAEIDVDIILDESPDTLTTQEEQFKMLAELVKVYGPQAVPFKVLIELSALKNKRRVLELLEGGDDDKAGAAQMAQMQAQLQQMQLQAAMAEQQAKTAKYAAEARKTAAQAEQVEMETQLVRSIPDLTPNVNI